MKKRFFYTSGPKTFRKFLKKVETEKPELLDTSVIRYKGDYFYWMTGLSEEEMAACISETINKTGTERPADIEWTNIRESKLQHLNIETGKYEIPVGQISSDEIEEVHEESVEEN